MGRPPEHDEATRADLLDAAESLLAEVGPDAVGVRDIAAAAGVTTRAVYSLFGSKEALLHALATRAYRQLAVMVSAVRPTDHPGADLVTAGIEGFREFALSRPGLYRLAFERVPATVLDDPGAGDASLASYEALTRWIARAQRAGVIDDRPEAEVAFAFHACCAGLASTELSREPPPVGSGFMRPAAGIDGKVLWHGALTALVAGMAPRDGR